MRPARRTDTGRGLLPGESSRGTHEVFSVEIKLGWHWRVLAGLVESRAAWVEKNASAGA